MIADVMDSGVTATAERQQVVQSVVSLLLGRGGSLAVDVVNVQVFLAAAMLASVIVSLQSGFTVAAEIVVIAGFFCVAFQSFFVGRKPFVNFGDFGLFLATRASLLRPSKVLKVIAAIRAHEYASDGRSAFLPTVLLKSLAVVFGAIGWPAGRANFLDRSCRLVGCFTNNANPLSKPVTGLAVGLQCTRLAPLGVWGSPNDGRAAVGTVDGAICFHDARLNELQAFAL